MERSTSPARCQSTRAANRSRRHQVEDLSFGPLFPGGDDELGGEEAPAPRTTPNTSAKRRRLDGKDAPRPRRSSVQSRSGGQAPDVYDLPDEHERSSPVGTPLGARRRQARATPGSAPHLRTENIAGLGLVEEVGESPIDAPGSGQRRRVPVNAAASTSAALQQAVGASGGRGSRDSAVAPPSSIRTAKKRQLSSAGPKSAASARRLPVVTEADDVDELSPVATAEAASPSLAKSSTRRRSSGKQTPSAARATRRSTRPSADRDEIDELSPASAERTNAVASPSPPAERPRKAPSAKSLRPPSATTKRRMRSSAADEVDELSPEQPDGSQQEEETPVRSSSKRKRRAVQSEEAEEEAAQSVDDAEAARRIGRKRPRTAQREASPDLSSQPPSADRAAPRRRKRAKASPAKQKQPPAQKAKAPPAQRRKSKAGDDAGGGGGTVGVTVQRFARKLQLHGDDADADAPFAGRAGVNVVDVLAQMSEEVLEISRENLREGIRSADDAADKRELRAKLRVVDAYREELRTRLLDHVRPPPPSPSSPPGTVLLTSDRPSPSTRCTR